MSTDSSSCARAFPGGNIGDLAVNGTVNDVAMAGARPLFLSSAMVLEEGLALAELGLIAETMGQAAPRSAVRSSPATRRSSTPATATASSSPPPASASCPRARPRPAPGPHRRRRARVGSDRAARHRRHVRARRPRVRLRDPFRLRAALTAWSRRSSTSCPTSTCCATPRAAASRRRSTRSRGRPGRASRSSSGQSPCPTTSVPRAASRPRSALTSPTRQARRVRGGGRRRRRARAAPGARASATARRGSARSSRRIPASSSRRPGSVARAWSTCRWPSSCRGIC